MEFKVIISDGGSTYQKEIKGEEAARLVGLRIGEQFDGGLIGESKTLQVTGGTDKDGFPMRRGIVGSRRIKVLLRGGPGFNPKRDGERRKKRVRGDTISEDTVQINTKVVAEREKKAKKKKVEEKVEVEKPTKPKEKKVEVEKPTKPKEKEKKVEAKKAKEEKPKEAKEEKPKEAKEEKPKEAKEEKPKAKAEERIVPLTKVRGVGKKTADLLTTAGVTSAQELFEADTAKLSKKTGLTANQIEKLKAAAEEVVG